MAYGRYERELVLEVFGGFEDFVEDLVRFSVRHTHLQRLNALHI